MASRALSQPTAAGTLAGVGAILLWSTTVAFVRSLSEQVGPLTAATAVYLIGGLFCLARRAWFGSPCAHFRAFPPLYLWGCGGLFVPYTVVLFLAIGQARDRAQVLEVGLVNYLWPALTILFSLILLHKRSNWWLPVGTLLALAGVFLAMTQGATVSWRSFWGHFQDNPWAYLLALTAAGSWALYSNLTRRWAPPQAGSAVDLFIPVTGLVLLGLRLCSPEPGAWNVHASLEAVFLGVVTALAYGLWELAMQKGDVLLVAACSYLTPFFSTVVSCFYLGIRPQSELWVGCLLIVAGSILSWQAVSERLVPQPDNGNQPGLPTRSRKGQNTPQLL